MSIVEVASGLTILVWVAFYGLYCRAVLAGTTKPSLAFWLTVAVIDWVAFGSSIASRIPLLTLTQIALWTVGSTIVAIVTLTKQKGRVVFQPLDRVCMALSACGIALWLAAGSPQAAVGIQAVTMTISGIPYFANALAAKEKSRDISISLLGSVCSLFTVQNWQSWPVYILPVVGIVMGGTSLTCSILGHRKKQAL